MFAAVLFTPGMLVFLHQYHWVWN